jgi:DedD protein
VKERLTGAIILVVLIVLLVPELLSGPSRSVPAPQAAATSSEEPPLRSYTIDLADDSHSADSSVGTSNASPQATGPEQPTPIADSSTPAQQGDSDAQTEGSPNSPQGAQAMAAQAPASSVPSTTPQEQPRPTASREQGQSARPPQQRPPAVDRAETSDRSSTTGGWMVQLGVFSIQANAERLAQELRSQGFHALVSENSGGGRPLWRVRAGPVAERAAAEQLNARLRAAGHAGSVVPK